MRLKHLTIANCSRVADIEIDVRDNLVLIGPNGSGKTTVLFCLDMLLGMNDLRLRNELTADFLRDASKPLIVEAVFTNLFDGKRADAAELGDRKHDGTDSSRNNNRAESNSVVERSRDILPAEVGSKRLSPADAADAADAARAASGTSAAGKNSLTARLEACLKHGRVVITRQFPQFESEKTQREIRRELLGWALFQTQNSLQGALEKVAGAAGDTKPESGSTLKDIGFEIKGPHALSAQKLFELVSKKLGIIAIDEPEAHLHPSSQRSLIKKLKADASQKILVTHSPTIAGLFEPDEIVVIKLDGSAVQPREGFLRGDTGMLARWWIGKQLEPLTAGSVIAVEGPSDRIIVDRVANAIGFDLDRHDVVVVETNGCGDMKVMESIFGSGGFNIPLFELIDKDAADEAAKRFDIDEADLEMRNVFVSDRDLEDEYVQAIGAKRLWERFKAARTFPHSALKQCAMGPGGYPTEADLAQFIRAKSKRKIPAALVAADLIDANNAPRMGSVAKLLEAASTEPR